MPVVFQWTPAKFQRRRFADLGRQGRVLLMVVLCMTVPTLVTIEEEKTQIQNIFSQTNDVRWHYEYFL